MEKIMKALVTGGTGITGSNLVKKLINQNYQVRVLARSSSKTELLSQMGVEINSVLLLERASTRT